MFYVINVTILLEQFGEFQKLKSSEMADKMNACPGFVSSKRDENCRAEIYPKLLLKFAPEIRARKNDC